MIIKYLCNTVLPQIRTCFLLTELTCLMALIPLPVYKLYGSGINAIKQVSSVSKKQVRICGNTVLHKYLMIIFSILVK